MNIWLKILIGIGSIMMLSLLFNLIREMMCLLGENNSVRMYQNRTERLDLLTNIYVTASNVYLALAQKGIILADYAYLAEVAIYGIIKELGGDTTTLLQKILQFMNKPKDNQGGGKTIILSPGPQGPKTDRKKVLTDKDIDKILDKWEKEHSGWRDKDKNKGNNGLS
ncbi:MAG: hypothetical protein ACFFAU_01420 [Candidatus Hodarchaeota archaeon]